ncbi:MAG: non-canonical purine NTP pyrophosphatase, partial [Thermoanaerobaculia bacterium]|nr:non-canonical purine NTP pyrophosphatase [Thermoanaerobaculia bacterium]
GAGREQPPRRSSCGLTLSPSQLHFVTSNPHKAAEVEALLGGRVVHVELSIPEIQAGSVEEIVRSKLDLAKRSHPAPIAVEDVSLEIESLGGFPGPYVKWLIEAAGGNGLGMIAAGLSSRRATARCVVGLWDGTRAHLVQGTVDGEVLTQPAGDRSFGWDAWFRPDGASGTYGEMTREEKSERSHRARAWRQLRTILANLESTVSGAVPGNDR